MGSEKIMKLLAGIFLVIVGLTLLRTINNLVKYIGNTKCYREGLSSREELDKSGYGDLRKYFSKSESEKLISILNKSAYSFIFTELLFSIIVISIYPVPLAYLIVISIAIAYELATDTKQLINYNKYGVVGETYSGRKRYYLDAFDVVTGILGFILPTLIVLNN